VASSVSPFAIESFLDGMWSKGYAWPESGVGGANAPSPEIVASGDADTVSYSGQRDADGDKGES
jgi:hypothetical protein